MAQETKPLRRDFGSVRVHPLDDHPTRDWVITNSTELQESPRPDATGAAIEVCKKWLLYPYRGALIMLGWLSWFEDSKSWHANLQQGCVILVYLCIIFATFILKALVCFQRDILFLNKEVCDVNLTIDVDRVCCRDHIITAFVVPDLLILTSYLFGIYLFSHAETEYLSKLAEEVFTKTAHATGDQFPKKLLATIGAYFVAGIAWIIFSLVIRVFFLVAFKYWDSEVVVQWSDSFKIAGSAKQALIVLSVIGFIFLDIIYTASIINYAIQSELNLYLLRAINRSVSNKIYSNLDEGYKEVNDAKNNLQVLNGKTATGASLVIFNLSIYTIVGLQQLEQLSSDNYLLPPHGLVLCLIVASLNTLLWASMVVFAFVQASRVTGAGHELKSSAVSRRAHSFQYTVDQQSDLDSFVMYTQAVKLRAKLFGVPIVPWAMHAAVAVLCLVLILMIKMDLYNPYPNV